MKRARIQLMGVLTVFRDGAEVELPRSKKTRALLAYLAASHRPQRRARLLELLWPDVVDPRGALRWSLSKLRAALEDDTPLFRTEGDTVELGDTELWVDARVLRGLVVAEASTAELLATHEACGGTFLEELALPELLVFQGWVVAERERLRRAQRAVLDELVRRHQSEPAAALPFVRERARRDVDDDRAHADLLTTLVAAGEVNEAEAHFDAHRAWLASRGEKPSALLGGRWAELRGGGSGRSVTHDARGEERQQIQFCTTSDGVRLAFAKSGGGPPLVKTANWLNHLEFDWESVVWRHWMRELGREHTLWRYDERGNGLSDRDVEDWSLDAFVTDLEAVIEAAGLERYPVLGISQGAAVAVAHAVRHPERVSHLVLFAGFARGWRARGVPREIETGEALLTLARHGWGKSHPAFRQVFTSLFFADADAEQVRHFNELQRRTTSPRNAVRLMETVGGIDVTELLPRVTVPTLVLHARHDAIISFEEGRALATGIPDARFVPLESRNHLLVEGEPAFARFMTELRSFLAASR